jgi:hypothetical protein
MMVIPVKRATGAVGGSVATLQECSDKLDRYGPRTGSGAKFLKCMFLLGE